MKLNPLLLTAPKQFPQIKLIPALIVSSLFLGACGEEITPEPATPAAFALAAASAINGLENGAYTAAPGFLSGQGALAAEPITTAIEKVRLLTKTRELMLSAHTLWPELYIALEQRFENGPGTYNIPMNGGELTLTAEVDPDTFSETWHVDVDVQRDDFQADLSFIVNYTEATNIAIIASDKLLLRASGYPVNIAIEGSLASEDFTLEFLPSEDAAISLPEGYDFLLATGLQQSLTLPQGFSADIRFRASGPTDLCFDGSLQAQSSLAKIMSPNWDDTAIYFGETNSAGHPAFFEVNQLQNFQFSRSGHYSLNGATATASTEVSFDSEPPAFWVEFAQDGALRLPIDPANQLQISGATQLDIAQGLRLDARFAGGTGDIPFIKSTTLAGDLGTLEVTTDLAENPLSLWETTLAYEIEDITGNHLIYRADGQGEITDAIGVQVGNIEEGQISIEGSVITQLPSLERKLR